MGYTITQIEDAIINVLNASVMGGYCKKIASYQIEGGDLEEQIRLLVGQLPCALIIFSGGEFSYGLSRTQDEKMTFSVLLCAQSLRGRGEARRDTIGTYQMIEDLREILSFNAVGLGIDPFIPTRVLAEVNTKYFSAYSMEFETSCGYSVR